MDGRRVRSEGEKGERKCREGKKKERKKVRKKGR